MDKCMWVAAGYPPLVAAIVALWVALQKSQASRLKEREDEKKVWAQLRSMVRDKTRRRREGNHE